MRTLLVVDFMNLARAVFHAVPELTGPDGRPVNALKGFISCLGSAMDQLKPTDVMIAMEGGKNWRFDLFKDYKANREPSPEAFKPQVPMILQFIEAAGITTVTPESGEADDVLASIAAHAVQDRVYLYTSDKDARTLVSDRVKVVMRVQGGGDLLHIGPEQVFKKFGVQPNQLRDFLAFMGDTVDNVPGVDGIGPVTAAKLLNKYGSGEGVYAYLSEITGKTKELLSVGRDRYELSRKLITLDDTLPVPACAPLAGTEKFDAIFAVLRQYGISASPRKFLASVSPAERAKAASSMQAELF